MLPKSTEVLIGMFAVLKADCIYVPLDAASPAARLARILHSSDSRCVLANGSTAALLNEVAELAGMAVSCRVGWRRKR